MDKLNLDCIAEIFLKFDNYSDMNNFAKISPIHSFIFLTFPDVRKHYENLIHKPVAVFFENTLFTESKHIEIDFLTHYTTKENLFNKIFNKIIYLYEESPKDFKIIDTFRVFIKYIDINDIDCYVNIWNIDDIDKDLILYDIFNAHKNSEEFNFIVDFEKKTYIKNRSIKIN